MVTSLEYAQVAPERGGQVPMWATRGGDVKSDTSWWGPPKASSSHYVRSGSVQLLGGTYLARMTQLNPLR